MKEVKFKRIDIENFLSVGNETVSIDLETGINVITGVNHDKEDSKNGVGKTTIADALFFCLFGTTIRDLKKDEIINNINQKNCRVKLTFDILENKKTVSYLIERKISPNKVYLEIDGVDSTKSSMPKTTEEICRIIGSTQDVFKNSVIMTVNGTIPFMAQKKVEKRKFCEGLFDLGVFQDMLLEGRKRYNEVKNEIAIEEAKLSEVKTTLENYVDQKKKKDEYRVKRIEQLLGRRDNNTKELDELEGTLKEVSGETVKEFNDNIALLENNSDKITDGIRKLIRRIATNEEKINTKKQTIKELKEFGDMCDKCKRPFTEDDKNSRNEKIHILNTEIKSIENTIIDTKTEQKEHEQLKSKCLKAIDKQKTNINELNSNVEHNKNVSARIDQLNTWNNQIKIDINELKEEKDENQELIDDTKTRVESVQQSLNSLKKRLNVLDSVKHIVSEEGVKSFIIKKLLKILNGKLAYYLNALDAPCRFKFNEYFDEQIINDKGQECSYDNFSSGERKRIDLAILFTFMDIRRLQGNTSINVTFYDEILDTSLDDKGIEAFLEIIAERVEKYNEACYIISHKASAIKTATNDVIFLEKKDGFTTVGNFTEDIV